MQVAGELGAVEDRQPAVGDLAGELEVPRPDRGEVDRQPLAHRVHGQPQRLARAVRQRQGPVLPLVRDGLAAQRHRDDVDVLAGAPERVVEPDAVPALAHLRARDAEPEPEAATGERVERRGGHRGGGGRAGRDLHHRGAQADPLGQRTDPGEHGRRVRAVRLRRPGDGVAEPVGLLREGDVVGVVAGAPVAEVQPEFHGPEASGVLPTAGPSGRRYRTSHAPQTNGTVRPLGLAAGPRHDDLGPRRRRWTTPATSSGRSWPPAATWSTRRTATPTAPPRRRSARSSATSSPATRSWSAPRPASPGAPASGWSTPPAGRCCSQLDTSLARLAHVVRRPVAGPHVERRRRRSRRPSRRWSGR